MKRTLRRNDKYQKPTKNQYTKYQLVVMTNKIETKRKEQTQGTQAIMKRMIILDCSGFPIAKPMCCVSVCYFLCAWESISGGAQRVGAGRAGKIFSQFLRVVCKMFAKSLHTGNQCGNQYQQRFEWVPGRGAGRKHFFQSGNNLAKCLQNVCSHWESIWYEESGCRQAGIIVFFFNFCAIILQNVCKIFAHTENQHDMRRVGAGGQEEASPISIICAPLADGASTQNPLVR